MVVLFPSRVSNLSANLLEWTWGRKVNNSLFYTRSPVAVTGSHGVRSRNVVSFFWTTFLDIGPVCALPLQKTSFSLTSPGPF